MLLFVTSTPSIVLITSGILRDGKAKRRIPLKSFHSYYIWRIKIFALNLPVKVKPELI
jgi:hypothetical protein